MWSDVLPVFTILKIVFLSMSVPPACKGDPDAVRHFFFLKIQQIPSNWTTAYDQARQHDDTVKIQVEQIKLDTAARIRETFTTIWEEEE